MNRFMKTSIVAAVMIGVTSLTFNAPADAHHNNNNAYLNALAMQMYANQIAQQQQAAYYNSCYNQPNYPVYRPHGYNVASYAHPWGY